MLSFSAPVIAVSLVLLLSSASLAWPTGPSMSDADDFANGPLQEQPDQMRKLVRWTLNGSTLAIRKDWKSVVSSEQKQQQFDDTVEKMMERGFDEDTARRLAEQTLKNKMVDEPLGAAFMQLARGNASQGRSSSGNRTQYEFRGRDLQATAERENDQLRIAFAERNGPRREWSIEDRGDGGLVFRYFGDDFLVQLNQRPDGHVQLVRVRGRKAESFEGSDFLSLQDQHPAVVDKWLLPLFDHLGFSLPRDRTHPSIRRRVLERLKSSDNVDPSRFDQLIADLNSDQFAIRDRATETLRTGRDLYRQAMAAVLKRPDLTMEVRTRLSRILESSSPESEVDRIIRQQNLLQTPEYLVSLLTPDDEAQNRLICRQLERITGESFTPSSARQRWPVKPASRKPSTAER